MEMSHFLPLWTVWSRKDSFGLIVRDCDEGTRRPCLFRNEPGKRAATKQFSAAHDELPDEREIILWRLQSGFPC